MSVAGDAQFLGGLSVALSLLFNPRPPRWVVCGRRLFGRAMWSCHVDEVKRLLELIGPALLLGPGWSLSDSSFVVWAEVTYHRGEYRRAARG